MPIDPQKNTVDKTGRLRVDFLFSYWLIGWFLVYYFTPSKNKTRNKPISSFIRTHLNPKLGFYLATIENIIVLLVLVYYRTELWTIVKYIFMLLLLKILPLYLLSDYSVQWVHDTVVLVVIFAFYNIYLAFNDTNLYEIYKRTFVSFKNSQNETPMFSLIQRLFRL
jgi:hypothetical protein